MARDNAAREPEPERVVNFEKKKRSKGDSNDGSQFLTSNERREALGFVLIASAVILLLSLILNPSELRGVASSQTPATAGRFGRWVAAQVGIMFGFGGLMIPLSIGAWGVAIFQGRPQRALFAKGLALAVGLVAVCAGLGLVWDGGYLGGALGDRLASDLYQVFGLVSFVVVFFTLVVSLVIGTPLSFSSLGAAAAVGALKAWQWALATEEKLAERIRAGRADKSETPPAANERSKRKPAIDPDSAENAAVTGDPAAESQMRELYENTQTRVVVTPILKLLSGSKSKKMDKIKDSLTTSADSNSQETPNTTATPTTSSADSTNAASSHMTRPVTPDVIYTPIENFTLPSIALLNDPIAHTETLTEEDWKRKAQGLQDALQDHGIVCKVGDITPGPTVTRFEVIPGPGVTVASIQARADDIALAMAAPSIRLEAPIPGKSAVGIEIPNRTTHMVTLKEVLGSEEFKRLREISPLTVALGQDIAGNPVVVDLRKMPHILIAGSTGSGKSVCINSIVNSLLLSAKPTEVRMLMVDPKVVELQEYNDIPHLLAPVVTDARKAPRVLEWTVLEMERRYQVLARAGVRDIESYNKLVPEAPVAAAPNDFVDLDEEVDLGSIPNRMPYILTIVDEFGDLMVVAKKECEESIIRIAQMARAVGIHLVIATQRPSVDVITGVIKANLPSRLSFQVSSKIDSRTILDTMGAERLLGRGDMLFKPGDRPKPIRLQGAYIGGDEIKAVIKHYSDQGKAQRELIIDEAQLGLGGGNNSLAGEDDPLLDQALRIALEDNMGSVSRLQRRLQIGHPRAARLVDIMEARGLVTPPDGSKPRKLLFDASYFDPEKKNNFD